MSEFLHMGGYAFFVWTSFGLFAVVMIWCAVAPILRRRRFQIEYREQRAVMAQRKNNQ
jgi:heme exporter protein D